MKIEWLVPIVVLIFLIVFFTPYEIKFGPVPRPCSLDIEIFQISIQANMVGMTFFDAANKLAVEVGWSICWGKDKAFFIGKKIKHSDVGKTIEQLLIQFCEEDSSTQSIIMWQANIKARKLNVFLKEPEVQPCENVR